MRIISGKFKGKTINFLKNSKTRPLKDNVKESIFNILTHSKYVEITLKNSNVLDLYSGVGSFGLECLSRDAKKVTFIERDKEASKILTKNLKLLSFFKKSLVLNTEIEGFLKKDLQEKFNIFFFDPPFSDEKYINNLALIKKNEIYTTKNIVIIHREKKTEDKINNYIDIFFSKNYGRSKIIFGKFN